ncbi:acyl-coenzyme A synthetase ACSM1, mitochondrial-like isoform X2 [Perognathus longimembris pacificus]|uniref:acyl-coenzyme A synthetase ACSM1, mitochondrial-like isoform X2 n=1 Tax=Perognathus longimembris pacificus TaxID=214514 RepID=UPI002019531E|nr:acyl-coenzyme A synthetase ACSM1, mitochondrial-like isoform X2 [Perognathus longimembris pacificus]
MQWLVRGRILWGAHLSYHSLRLAPQQLRYQHVSGVGAPTWSDQYYPEEFNFASHVLDYWAQMEKEGKRGPKPAFWWVSGQGKELKWSFRDMADLTRRTANVLTQTCGLRQGDHLALILPRVPEWWLITVGCLRTGVVFMPGTSQLKAKDIHYRLQMSEAKAIVTTETLAPEVDSIASDCPALKSKLLVSDHSREGWLDFRSLVKSASPEHTCIKSKTEDPMVIFFTSGTTGLPKMAKHNQGLALRSCLYSCRQLLQLKTTDVLWCLSDPGWILAVLGCLLEPWAAGSTVFVHHLPQFDPQDIVQTLFQYPITQCLAAPAVYRMILQQKQANLRFPTLEHCSTGGEALLPEEHEQWKSRTGLLLYEIYGQSETGISCGVSRGMKIKLGSMGKAIIPFDIQIIDEKGNILPPNTEGYIGIRIKPVKPMGIFIGYENNPEKNAEVQCGDFYNSGDRAKMDSEGYIWFLGRGDDVINASGYRIGPSEVENALAEHPAVAESAVVSSPDPRRGEVRRTWTDLGSWCKEGRVHLQDRATRGAVSSSAGLKVMTLTLNGDKDGWCSGRARQVPNCSMLKAQ